MDEAPARKQRALKKKGVSHGVPFESVGCQRWEECRGLPLDGALQFHPHHLLTIKQASEFKVSLA
jgi:hypothetical protein